MSGGTFTFTNGQSRPYVYAYDADKNSYQYGQFLGAIDTVERIFFPYIINTDPSGPMTNFEQSAYWAKGDGNITTWPQAPMSRFGIPPPDAQHAKLGIPPPPSNQPPSQVAPAGSIGALIDPISGENIGYVYTGDSICPYVQIQSNNIFYSQWWQNEFLRVGLPPATTSPTSPPNLTVAQSTELLADLQAHAVYGPSSNAPGQSPQNNLRLDFTRMGDGTGRTVQQGIAQGGNNGQGGYSPGFKPGSGTGGGNGAFGLTDDELFYAMCLGSLGIMAAEVILDH